MLRWFKQTCFSNLELESQKNRLLVFLMIPIFLLAELNIAVNVPLWHPTNLQFSLVYLLIFGCCLFLITLPSMQKAFKYIVMSSMILFSMFQLWLFNDYPIIYQIMYINLALALIYLDGYLVMFTGLTTALLTGLGFIFWKNVFFPQIDIALANIPIILILQTTVVLWGVTKIGVRFNHYIHHNQRMNQLLRENEQHLLLIHEKNQALEQYAAQVEKLAVLEERNRVARELHDTIGHSLTSIIAGLELLKRTAADQKETAEGKIDSLLLTARNGLEEVRQHVHMMDKTEADEPLGESIERLASEFARNADTAIEFIQEGEPSALTANQRLALLRCVQEALTNAVRHGDATRIRVLLRNQDNELTLKIEDNGRGTDELSYGFGLKSMQARMDAVHAKLEISSGFEGGFTIICRLPLRVDVNSSEIRILLAEDQELIAESFSLLLQMEEDLSVTGIARDGADAVEQCEMKMPDLLLMDIHMPVMDGVEATRIIKHRWPQIKIIILTSFQDIGQAAEAISYGADGYLLKSVQPKHLAAAIRMVNAGGSLVSMETAHLLLKHQQEAQDMLLKAPHNKLQEDVKEADSSKVLSGNLNDKEIEILNYLADGLKYKEIAQKMNYSEGTVKNYVSTIYSKLSVENRMQAVKKAQELNRI